jgi:hypothetical protein
MFNFDLFHKNVPVLPLEEVLVINTKDRIPIGMQFCENKKSFLSYLDQFLDDDEKILIFNDLYDPE